MQIRLNGSSNNMSGRVEIFNPNFGWGTVCDNSWYITNSNVVCRQLGFTGAAILNRDSAYYGEGNGTILLVNFRCNGKESYIWDCPNNALHKHACTHQQDAGVECITCKKGYIIDGLGCVGMYPPK
jgi:hypothetical protein